MNERLVSSRALYGVVYTTSISSVYFALGAQHNLAKIIRR